MATETPYPGWPDRLVRVETRLDQAEATVTAHGVAIAVHSEQLAVQKDDLRDVAAVFKEESEKTNARIDRLLKAAWALVLVLIPVAASLITIAVNR